MSEWKPIDTHPDLDDGPFLVWDADAEQPVVIAEWEDGGWMYDDAGRLIGNPTHWQPLLGPPDA